MPSRNQAVQQEPKSTFLSLYKAPSSNTTTMSPFLLGWRMDRSEVSVATAAIHSPNIHHPSEEIKPYLAIVPYTGMQGHVIINSQRQCDWLPLLHGKRWTNVNVAPSLPRFGLFRSLRPEILVEIRCSRKYLKEVTTLVQELTLNTVVNLSQYDLFAHVKSSIIAGCGPFPKLMYGDNQYRETKTDRREMMCADRMKFTSHHETILDMRRGSTKKTKPQNLSLIDDAEKMSSHRRGLSTTGVKKRKSKFRAQKPRKLKRIQSSNFRSPRNINMKRPLAIPSITSPQDFDDQPPSKIFVSSGGIVRRHETCRELQLQQYPSAGRREVASNIIKVEDLCVMLNDSLTSISKNGELRNRGTSGVEIFFGKEARKKCENCRLQETHRQYPSAGRRDVAIDNFEVDDLCAMFNDSLTSISKKCELRNRRTSGVEIFFGKKGKECENCRLQQTLRVKSTLDIKTTMDGRTPRGGHTHHESWNQRRKSLEAVCSLTTLQRMFSDDTTHALLQILRPPAMSLTDYQKALQRIYYYINVVRKKFINKIRKIQRIVRKRPSTSLTFTACNHPPNKICVTDNGIFASDNMSVSELDIDKLCALFDACLTTTS